MSEFKKGKDPECAMFDCPHKKELEMAVDELNQEKKKNEELNARLESVDALIEQGLVDVKGLLNELFRGSERIDENQIRKVIERVEKVFDTQKITDIVNDNLRLRKELHQRELKITEQKQEIIIISQERQLLNDTIRVREERDKNLIVDMRNMDKQAEEQFNLISKNKLEINQQELKLKALEGLTQRARITIKELQKEHEYLAKEIKAHKSPKMTKEGRKVLSLIRRVESLKNSHRLSLNALFTRDREYKAKVLFFNLKTLYFNLANFEKQKLVGQYDEVARLMGE